MGLFTSYSQQFQSNRGAAAGGGAVVGVPAPTVHLPVIGSPGLWYKAVRSPLTTTTQAQPGPLPISSFNLPAPALQDNSPGDTLTGYGATISAGYCVTVWALASMASVASPIPAVDAITTASSNSKGTYTYWGSNNGRDWTNCGAGGGTYRYFQVIWFYGEDNS